MHLLLEYYPEFKEDFENEWNTFILNYNFQVSLTGSQHVLLSNDTTIIELFLNGGDRISYLLKNRKTGQSYDLVSLLMFSNKTHSDIVTVEHNNYPISNDQWFDLYAEEDFRSICKIDLPIIKDEILTNWKQLVEGDFSFEPEYLKWLEWRRKPENKRKSITELSYNSYKKMQLNKGSFPKEK